MDEIVGIVRLSLIVAFGLILPQILGHIAYTSLRKTQWRFVSILAPPLVFLAIADLYWGYQAKSIREAGHYVCGLFGAAASISTAFGTIFHFLIAMIIYIARRMRASRQSRYVTGPT